jgi:hypothetical protein
MRNRSATALRDWAALRRIDPGVRCCLMSGHPGDLDEAASLPGVTAVLEKPFWPDLFEATVRKAMAG